METTEEHTGDHTKEHIEEHTEHQNTLENIEEHQKTRTADVPICSVPIAIFLLSKFES